MWRKVISPRYKVLAVSYSSKSTMITISNYDRDRAAAYIEAYAETLAAAARSNAKAANRRRMALLLARKLRLR